MSKYHTCSQRNRLAGTWRWTCTCTSRPPTSPALSRTGGPGVAVSWRRHTKVALKSDTGMCEPETLAPAALLLSSWLLKTAPSVSAADKGDNRAPWASERVRFLGSHIPFAGHIAAFHLCLPLPVSTLTSSGFMFCFMSWVQTLGTSLNTGGSQCGAVVN